MMTIEELNRLKEKIAFDYGVGSCDVDPTYYALDKLIDAEIARQSVTVDEIELMNGMIGIWLTGSRKPVMVPQCAQWGDVVRKLANKVVIGEL